MWWPQPLLDVKGRFNLTGSSLVWFRHSAAHQTGRSQWSASKHVPISGTSSASALEGRYVRERKCGSLFSTELGVSGREVNESAEGLGCKETSKISVRHPLHPQQPHKSLGPWPGAYT
jgi:hypothetical protein